LGFNSILTVYFRHNIDISAGDEPKMGVTMRIGLMGLNSRTEVVECFVEALKDGLNSFGDNKQ
jgi:aspartate aminotransferase-like enzyme